jgi:hypothetical protein
MSHQAATKRRGNPNWVKGGPSPNPLGRPRTGLAFAERGRERIDPDKVLELAVRVLEDETLPPRERLAIVMPVVDRIYVKPPTSTQLEVTNGNAAPHSFGHLSLERQRELLAELRGGEANGHDPRLHEPSATDDDAS